MTISEALYTTRAMRRLRPDPIPPAVQARILDAAIRAPTPGAGQNWRFLLVDDPALKQATATLYQESQALGLAAHWAEVGPEVRREQERKLGSARYLAEHWAETPLLLFAFAQHDPAGSTVIPAVWSAMLAARAEGIGSTFTTLLSMFRQAETMALLGAPPDEGWSLAVTVPMGYPLGRWGVALRKPVEEVAARNGWQGDLGFAVPDPLWPGPAATPAPPQAVPPMPRSAPVPVAGPAGPGPAVATRP